jgi:hypothetical protein
MGRKSTSGRRRSVAIVSALPLLLAAPAVAGAPAGRRPGTVAARPYAAHRPVHLAFAVQTERRAWSWHGDAVFQSAGVLKAMLLVAYLREPYVRARIGNGALVRLARAAGMKRFRRAAVWGMSQIDARDQARFFLRIDRMMPRGHRAYGMRLLASVVPSQRWGAGRWPRPSGSCASRAAGARAPAASTTRSRC